MSSKYGFKSPEEREKEAKIQAEARQAELNRSWLKARKQKEIENRRYDEDSRRRARWEALAHDIIQDYQNSGGQWDEEYILGANQINTNTHKLPRDLEKILKKKGFEIRHHESEFRDAPGTY